MPLAFQPAERHPLIDTLFRTRVPRWMELNLAIDERDDMLDFAISMFEYDRDRALVSYFQNALEQFNLVRHISAWRGRPVRRMLDFASGYGRLTRLLVHEKLADEVTVADILEGGMEFQAEQFGVRTIVSRTRPEELVTPDRYDLIFVASLFTHLPASTFTRWLRRLADSLEADGLLIFSVHDESLAPEKVVDGISFRSSSESRVLDVEDYGSTWVTEEYVRQQVATLGANYDCVRLPRALAEWQDIYVISPSPIANPYPRRTPKGFVDQFAVSEEGVRISGWATLLDEKADRVEIRLDDEVVATTRDFESRPDVAAWLSIPQADAGWEAVIPLRSVRSFRYQVVTVSAFSKSNDERILYLGTLDALSGHVAHEQVKDLRNQLQARANEIAALSERVAITELRRSALEQEIAAMKQSRFWRARERWFATKRRLRLTNEP